MFRMFKSRKYLQRILLYVSLVMSLLVVVSSVTIYYNAQKTLVDMQYQANRKVLAQMDYNISYMNEMIKNMAISVFFDNDMIPIMYGDEDSNYFDLSRSILKINTTVASTTFLESIVVYNGKSEKFYSNNTLKDSELLYAKLNEFLNSGKYIPKMRLIPMSLDGNKTDYFSFMMYEALDEYHKHDSVMVFNIKSKWLFDNINIVNSQGNPGSSIFITDTSNRFIDEEHSSSAVTQADLKAILDQKKELFKAKTNYFDAIIKGTKYMITYQTIVDNGWQIITVQPYDILLRPVDKMRTVSLLSTAVFLLMAVVLSLVVSRRLYKPIEKLMRQVNIKSNRVNAETQPPISDELAYLSNAYNHIWDQMNTALVEKEAKRDIVQQFQMRKLLTDSASLSNVEWKEIFEQYALNILPENPYLLCVLKIDNYKEYEENNTAYEKNLMQFVIMNIIGEIVGRRFRNNLVDIKSDHLVLLASTDSMDETSVKEMIVLLSEAQQVLAKYYRLSISAAISSVISDYTSISDMYRRTLHAMKYRIIFGKKSMITPEMIQDNESNTDLNIPMELEKQLNEAMKSGQFKLMLEVLHKMDGLMVKFQYEQIIHSILRITVIMNQTFKEINRNRLKPIEWESTRIADCVLDKETLEEMVSFIGTQLQDFAKKYTVKDEEKNTVLIQVIKEMMETRFAEPDLSLPKIADHLKLSSSHIGKLFKNAEGVSVADYINEIRLQYALKLLEDKSYTVQEIMEKVGNINESNFYKMFKKRFGTTPKEYRIKRTIEQ